jgi:Domain of unknown function (DUF4333)
VTLSARGAGLVSSLVLALSGCGEVDVETHETERAIKSDIAVRTGARIKAVRCPDRVEAKKGTVFRCRAIARDGSTLPVRVRQIDDDGGVRWTFPGH